ncbi:MAG: UvrB/UvrC motif-containing protein, partial [Patescibacteria group bacterium]
GKAGNLKKRVASYFQKSHDYRIQKLVGEIKKIDYQKTDTVIEALILESQLIKKHQPFWNVREKDDKSFLYVEITKEKFPRVLLVRGKEKFAPSRAERFILSRAERFGPFVSASGIREALRVLRRIFPFSVHPLDKSKEKRPETDKSARPCFDYSIGLCPGVCVGLVSEEDYLKNIKNLRLIFRGKKRIILKNLDREMRSASKRLEFEKAEKFRRQIFSLRHIQDAALIKDSEVTGNGFSPAGNFVPRRIEGLALSRIEGYDISNLAGASAVGGMVVFLNGAPVKSEYRKFKIKTIFKPNDTGMLREVLRRRFKNPWPRPDLILVDGGLAQVNCAKEILRECGLIIPVLGIAKGVKRKNNKFIGITPDKTNQKILIKVRDEAHRFAIGYHKKVRSAGFMEKSEKN